jgi:hypothetical protein
MYFFCTPFRNTYVMIFWFTTPCSLFFSRLESISCLHVKCCIIFLVLLGAKVPRRRRWYRNVKKITDHETYILVYLNFWVLCDSVDGIATCYELESPGIESRWEARFAAPLNTGTRAHLSGNVTLSWGWSGLGVVSTSPSSLDLRLKKV